MNQFETDDSQQNHMLVSSDQESDQLLHPANQPRLPYANVTNILCWFFLKETIYFSANYVMDRVTFFLTFVLFRVGGFAEGMAVLGLVILAIDLFFCLSRDFQEAVGIVLGPYYSKGDSKRYYFYLVILIFWNVVFFLACLPFAFFQREFFTLLGVHSDILGPATAATKQYMLAACAFLSASNFIKGNTRSMTERAHQHQAAPEVQHPLDCPGHAGFLRGVERVYFGTETAIFGVHSGLCGEVLDRNRVQLGADFQVR